MPLVDVLIGNEEDFSAALGFAVEGVVESVRRPRRRAFKSMIRQVVREFPNLKVVATTLRTRDDGHGQRLGGDLLGRAASSSRRRRGANLEILDRVGGGDSFASGLIYGLLTGRGPQWAVECGAAHGALAMTTPGDTSMATLAEVERVMKGGTARVSR